MIFLDLASSFEICLVKISSALIWWFIGEGFCLALLRMLGWFCLLRFLIVCLLGLFLGQ